MILITGASGNVGHEVLKQALAVADDKVAGYEAANHLVHVRDEPSRVYPGAEKAIHSNGHLVLGAEHEKR